MFGLSNIWSVVTQHVRRHSSNDSRFDVCNDALLAVEEIEKKPAATFNPQSLAIDDYRPCVSCIESHAALNTCEQIHTSSATQTYTINPAIPTILARDSGNESDSGSSVSVIASAIVIPLVLIKLTFVGCLLSTRRRKRQLSIETAPSPPPVTKPELHANDFRPELGAAGETIPEVHQGKAINSDNPAELSASHIPREGDS